jgi:hypothetical protein
LYPRHPHHQCDNASAGMAMTKIAKITPNLLTIENSFDVHEVVIEPLLGIGADRLTLELVRQNLLRRAFLVIRLPHLLKRFTQQYRRYIAIQFRNDLIQGAAMYGHMIRALGWPLRGLAAKISDDVGLKCESPTLMAGASWLRLNIL